MSVFQIKKDGAFQEPEAVKRKDESGAWVDCESAKRLVDGARQEVWSAKKVFDLLQNTISTGSAIFSAEWELGLSYMTNKNEGGSITCVIAGDFTDPVLSFLLEGWFYTSLAQRYVAFGQVYAYGVKTDGTLLLNDKIEGANLAESPTQFTRQFTGNYTMIGFRIEISNYGITQFEPLTYFQMKNITIDGKKCVFDPTDDIYFN